MDDEQTNDVLNKNDIRDEFNNNTISIRSINN